MLGNINFIHALSFNFDHIFINQVQNPCKYKGLYYCMFLLQKLLFCLIIIFLKLRPLWYIYRLLWSLKTSWWTWHTKNFFICWKKRDFLNFSFMLFTSRMVFKADFLNGYNLMVPLHTLRLPITLFLFTSSMQFFIFIYLQSISSWKRSISYSFLSLLVETELTSSLIVRLFLAKIVSKLKVENVHLVNSDQYIKLLLTDTLSY